MVTNIPGKTKAARRAARLSAEAAPSNPWLAVPEAPVSVKPEPVAAPAEPPVPEPVAAPLQPPVPEPVAGPAEPPVPEPVAGPAETSDTKAKPWCDVFGISPWSAGRRRKEEPDAAENQEKRSHGLRSE